jgi:hypothetical protein
MCRPAVVCLSCQTLGHAKNLTVEGPLSFVASPALSRKTPAAAGASSSVRLPKVEAKVGAGCPSFGGQRTAASARKEGSSMHHASSSRSSRSTYQASCKCHCPSGDGRALCRRANLQDQLRHRSGSLRIQRWYASPFQIQGKAASPRAWPNPSFKRTRLRRSA